MNDNERNDNVTNDRDEILNDPQLTAYALDEIDDADEIARIERLLEVNAQAKAFVEDIRATGEMLTGELKRESMPALSAEDEAAMAREAVAAASECASVGEESDDRIGAPIPFPTMLVRSRTFKLSAGLAAAALVTIVATVAIVNRDMTPRLDDTYAIDEEAARARDMVQGAAPKGNVGEKRRGGSGQGIVAGRSGAAPTERAAGEDPSMGLALGEAEGLLESEASNFERRGHRDSDALDAPGLPERELAETASRARGGGAAGEHTRADTRQEDARELQFWSQTNQSTDGESTTDDKLAASPTTSGGQRSAAPAASPPEPDPSASEGAIQYDFSNTTPEEVANELTVLFAEVEAKKKTGDYENALNILARVQDVADQNRDELTQDEYEALRRNAAKMGEQIEGEQREAKLDQAAAQQKEVDAAAAEQRMQLELEREQKVENKLRVIRRAEEQGNYEEALVETKALLFLDPGNEAAVELREALEDVVDNNAADPFADAPRFDLERLIVDASQFEERRQQIANEEYARINDNPFKAASEEPLSTFSIDVDTASYSNVRRFINDMSMVPPADAVRIEELINNFDYDYAPPTKDAEHPFAVHTEISECPWNPEHRLARIGLKGYEVPADDRPATNLVFLIDSSGSMSDQNKLPLVQRSLTELVDNLTVDDRIAIVTYAGESRLVLDSTAAFERETIVNAINSLHAGGSTNGEGGLEMAYDIATDNYIDGGVNRVILCTDGDFNVGISDEGGLSRLIEEKRESNVFLSVLGFGMGNIKDNKLELLADKGNGHYAYIDNYAEAEKLFVDRLSGTLVTIAKDVKIQVDFNPTKVASYRLIGYENRVMAARDFNDDTKDAGEIGAGHTVTALYEIVPAGLELVAQDDVDDSVYVETAPTERAVESGELFNVRLRYKQPEASESTLWTIPVMDEGKALNETTNDFRFAAGVASFGMILRQSPYRGDISYGSLLDLAGGGLGKPSEDARGERSEFLSLVRRTREIAPHLFVEREKPPQPAEVEPEPPTDDAADDEPAAELSDSDNHNDG